MSRAFFPLLTTASLALLLLGSCGPRIDRERRPVPFDQPAEAQEYFARKRAPLGETTVPFRRYLEARRHQERLPRYDVGRGRLLRAGDLGAKDLGTWEELGPTNVGGRTRSLVIDPSDPDTLYAGGVSGGIWKTTDGGSTWSALDDFMANLAVVSLAMDPTDSSTIYAGTGEGFFNLDGVQGAGIFKTTDGGATWTQLAATDTSDFFYVSDVVVSPNDPGRLYAGTFTGVWRSTDGGATWTRVHATSVTGGCLDLEIRTDGATDSLFASCGTLETATVYRNTDAAGKGSWTAVLSEADMGRTTLALAPSSQDTVYALSASASTGGLYKVFRSTDGGTTWTTRVSAGDPVKLHTLLLTNPLFATSVECGLGASDTFLDLGWYGNAIAVDPLDPDRVWAGGVDLFRSDDGGSTWGLASFWWKEIGHPDFLHADQHRIVFDPGFDATTNKRMFVTNDGGVFSTDDARGSVVSGPGATCGGLDPGVNWTAANTDHFGVTQFYFGLPHPNGTSYFGGTQDHGTVRGTDGGGPGAWTVLRGGDGGWVAVDPTDTDTIYAENVGISILKATDGSSSTPTWVESTAGIVDDGLFINPFLMDPSDPSRLWTSGTFIWRTTNGAASWTKASTSLTSGEARVSALAVAPTNPDRVVAGMSASFTDPVAGGIYRTASGLTATGSTPWAFSQPVPGAWVSWLAFDPRDEMTVYATYSTFGVDHVWKSTDGGATWTPIDGAGATALPDIPVHSLVVDPIDSSRLYVGTDLGVYAAIDGGSSWAAANTGFAHVVTEALAVTDPGTGPLLFAFTHGRGAWRTPIATPVPLFADDFESGDTSEWSSTSPPI